MNNDVLFSSKDMTWTTPQKLFNILNLEFNFNIDVCASSDNTKCKNYITKEVDFLKWIPVENYICWMNPPYGRELGLFIRKAYEDSIHANTTCVCLVPARTYTKWWWNYCLKAAEIRFLKGRLKFGDSKSSAPFPSAIIIFKNHKNIYPIITWSSNT